MVTRSTTKQKVLAIETSCDETAVALIHVEKTEDKTSVRVLEHLVSSQISLQLRYGGVVPEVAARSHVPETVSLITKALGKKGMNAFDVITVTRGPGLSTALGVGLEAARTLAFLSGKPIIGVNHLEGHLASAWLNARSRKKWEYPLMALIVSGGHTELVLMKDYCDYKLVGQTRDDAAGEAFDKTARLMGLAYPGGPKIEKLAKTGNKKAFSFPRPMRHDGTLDFSFSGLKTAVRYQWDELKAQGRVDQPGVKEDVAASLLDAIIDILVEKTIQAAKMYNVKGVLLVGGVSASKPLRKELGKQIKKQLPGVAYFPSERKYITDNAAMIAAAGYWHVARGDHEDWTKMELDPEWNIG